MMQLTNVTEGMHSSQTGMEARGSGATSSQTGMEARGRGATSCLPLTDYFLFVSTYYILYP